jgi:hypothetical protein
MQEGDPMKKIFLCLAITILLCSTSRAAVIGVGDADTGGGIGGMIVDVFQFSLGHDISELLDGYLRPNITANL